MTTESSIRTPNLQLFLSALRTRPINASVDELSILLRRRQISGARRCALATANLLINVVAAWKPRGQQDLLTRVHEIAVHLVRSQPHEVVVGNVARRVLGLIREALDNHKGANKESNGDISSTVKDAISSHNDSLNEFGAESTVKEDVLDGMRELLDELDQADKQISEYSHEHVFPEESILIFGASHTTQRFLLDAAKRRKFRVFQVEGYPNEHESSHEYAMQGAPRNINEPASTQTRSKTLAAAGIPLTIIPDTQVFAILPRVNKVILSAQGTFSNGGCVLPCGAKSIATASQFHKIAVLVLSPIYRLSPAYPYDPRKLIALGDPSPSKSFGVSEHAEQIKTPGYLSDYVPPDMVSLYVTNIGGHTPLHMYRLASDHYRSQDVDL